MANARLRRLTNDAQRRNRARPPQSGAEPVTDALRATQLQHLPVEECYELLATQQIGRLGVNAEHYPLILPVNYGLDNGVIVIRTDAGAKLLGASHANVTFEVDDIDQHRRSGWSVLVKGLAEEVTPEHRRELVERTQDAAMEPWAPGDHGHWLRLIPHAVSGRRLIPGELPPIFEAAAYL
jgi:nitroimidazol reductase NimA-like FMN-containing flavoprotein (pyridoxamine 5'-phosphate oxidase superfamily)